MTLDFSKVSQISNSTMGEIVKITDNVGQILWQKQDTAKITVDKNSILRFSSETTIDDDGTLKVAEVPNLDNNGNIGY